MELAAIHHSMEKRDCYAMESGKMLIRIRTKQADCKQITLIYQDKYIARDKKDTRKYQVMDRVASDGIFDYYESIVNIQVLCMRYFFKLEDQEEQIVYYGNYEFFEEELEDKDYMFDCPQKLREEEQITIPEWAKGKVVYQVFPSRYANDKPVEESVWYQTPMRADVDLGGNLYGLLERLPYLHELGVDVLYMTPIFRSVSQHKYNTMDYYAIDERFGTTEILQKLVKEAHKLGMYVVLDAVFNHTGTEFFAFHDVLEKQEDSKYKDWYYLKHTPVSIGGGVDGDYLSFSYVPRMPKLNMKNPETEQYFLDVACYWIETCDIDGWRIDVGEEVVHSFWKNLRKRVKAIKPECLLIGEVWYFAPDFLEGDEWDGVMNYPFYLAVNRFVTEESISASYFAKRLSFIQGQFHRKTQQVLWNLISSHDTPRFLYRCGENKDKLRMGAAMLLLLPGMPMMYYGDEYAMTGGADPDCRRGMVWDAKYQDADMYQWYKHLITLRKQYRVLREGRMSDWYAEDENGIVVLRYELEEEKATLVFHCNANTAQYETYKGKRNELTGETFDGVLKPYESLLFMEAHAMSLT